MKAGKVRPYRFSSGARGVRGPAFQGNINLFLCMPPRELNHSDHGNVTPSLRSCGDTCRTKASGKITHGYEPKERF